MKETLESPQATDEPSATSTMAPPAEQVEVSPRRRAATPRPELLGAEARLDGTAAPLAWQPLPEAQEYHVQVASTPRFDALLFDETVGDSTSVTLYELLPADGTRLHWRVRARTPQGWTPFSPSAVVVAVNDEEAEAWQREHAERQATREDAAREDQLPPAAVTTLPYRTETTSATQAALFLVLILSVVVGLLLLNFL